MPVNKIASDPLCDIAYPDIESCYGLVPTVGFGFYRRGFDTGAGCDARATKQSTGEKRRSRSQ